MKNEKKLIALSIFILTIGIATILLATFTPYKAEATTQTPSSSNAGMILYAHAIPTTHTNDDGNIIKEETINILANFTLTDVATLNGADAKIVVYNFHVYSEPEFPKSVTMQS